MKLYEFTAIKNYRPENPSFNECSARKLIDAHREFFSKLPTGILMRGIDLLF
jgi:hypothetical protein